MRIAFVSESPAIWGAERSLANITSHLSNLGHQVSVLTCADGPLAAELSSSVDVRAVKFAPHWALNRSGSLSGASIRDLLHEPFDVLSGTRRLRSALAEHRPDVVVSFTTWRNFETIAACKALGVPCVLDVHDTLTGRLSSRALAVAVALADQVISPSRAAVSGIPARSLVDKLVVIPRPVDVDSRARGDSEKSGVRLQVALVGQISKHKGADLLLSAGSRLADVDIYLIGANESASAEELDILRCAETLANVFVVPRRAFDTGIYADFDIICNLSDHEAFGRTIVEGLAYGCTPVVTRGTGSAEIVTDTGLGVIIDRDVQQLQSTLELLRNRRNLLGPAARLGPELVRERYSGASVARSYADALMRSLRPTQANVRGGQ